MNYSNLPQEKGCLRPHQVNAKKEILSAWDQCDAVMLQMPTGTGKTYLFTSLVKDLLAFYKQNRLEMTILIVAHRTELIDQISDSLSRYGIPHGIIQGNREQHLWQRIQVGSIMSLLTQKNEFNVRCMDFDYIIVDEAHHSLADSYKRLFSIFPKAKKLGVTATPWRLNHETFLSIYDQLITTPQVSWFIQQGLLADFDYISIKAESPVQKMIDSTEVAQTGDFVEFELNAQFNTQRIRAKLFASYKKYAFNRKGIIYAINKQHAANIAYMYSKHGIKAVAIDCDTPKEVRKLLIEQFKSGEIKVLVNVNIFTEGFDCPDVSFIQLARPTRSLALYLQQVGRGLRVVKGKERTVILDNVGLYNYFGLPNANRKWQYHFKGHETPDEINYPDAKESWEESTGRTTDLEEDDEEMSIIRKGSVCIDASSVDDKEIMDLTEDFAVADYYWISGNSKKFKIYPLVKKRGRLTGTMGNCILEYDAEQIPLSFTYNTEDNFRQIGCEANIKIVLQFAVSLMGLRLSDVMNFNRLSSLCNKEMPAALTCFQLLKLLSTVKAR